MTLWFLFALLGQVSDIGLTLHLLANGGRELNPIMRIPWWGMVAFKLGLVALAYLGTRQYGAESGRIMYGMVGTVGFGAAAWNLYQVLK